MNDGEVEEVAEPTVPSRQELDAESESLLDGIFSRAEQRKAGAEPKADAEPVGGEPAKSSDIFDAAIPDDVVAPPAKAAQQAEPAVVAAPIEKKAEEPVPTFKEPKANHAFAQLRHEKAELEKKLADHMREMETLKSTQVQSQEMTAKIAELEERHKKELEQMEQRLGQYDLASTKAFKMKYDVPLNSILGRAANMLQKAGVSKEDADQLARELMQKPTLERAQQLSELVPALSGSLVNLYEDFDEIRANRDSAIRDWRNTKAALGVDEQHVQQAKALELAEGLTSQVIEQQAESGNPFFRRSASNEEWNKKVDERTAQFKGLIKTGDQLTLASLVAEGLTAREYRQMWEAERAKLAKLQADVNARFGVTVAPSGRAESAPARTKVVNQDDDSLIDNIMGRHLAGKVRDYPVA